MSRVDLTSASARLSGYAVEQRPSARLGLVGSTVGVEDGSALPVVFLASETSERCGLSR
jgi:hypothetical protein